MKKRTLSVLLAAVMAAGTLAACGGGSSAPAEKPAEEAAAEETVEEAAPEESAEGAILNIYCWNDEFKRRMRDHYPGYEDVDATHGKIGDVEVVFNITPNDNNAYQNNLDETLLKQADAAADEKIDIFLIEADYALKYVSTDFALPVKDLGITDADLADQYKYTQDVVTDSDGNLKALSWQGCPGLMIYSREAAKEVFGTDEPAEIQTKFSDWDAFVASAKVLKDAGYQVVSSVNDTYRVYSNNVTTPWVVDGKINLDENIKKWVDDSKALVDAGYAGTNELWLADWTKGFYPEGKVFAYFGPAWLIDFCMAADTEGSIANAGGWAATEGPQAFNWGGTWICGAAGTDNPTLIADIMRQLTCNEEIMTDIVKQDNDFVNNKPAMEAMAKDETYSDAVLGGQNALPLFCAGADKISMDTVTKYDQACTEEFQKAMKNYFEGKESFEDAYEAFCKAVIVKHPDLTY